ncbi:hypothetical protein DICVIV_06415 [Dictyocaulus viviparus]|uniref:MTP large subunit lipid-binding domain-containing protein n=1 Tax=Dictyocaulus viviparus TaxID=29172 RepID=A0A0D8XUH4_DICVI|nr:hypothetical protein DICVIV_06415 [Dictyocaulus viviparus]
MENNFQYWLADINNNDALYWKVANTIATVLKRRCDQTISKRKSCHMGKEKIVSKFINDISKCQTEQCSLKSLHVLRNIPISTSVEMARGYLCSTHSTSLQIAALQLIKAASSSLYDSKARADVPLYFTHFEYIERKQFEYLAKLTLRSKIFKFKTSEILTTTLIEKMQKLRCIPDQQHVGTMLFRTETLNPDNHEKWQYLYKAVKSTGQQDILFVMDVTGLDSLDFGQTMSANPQAEFRLSVLGHSLPPVTLFKNSAELMNIVWNANGQTIKAFEGNVMLRDTSSTIPLLSGLTVQVSSTGALSLKLLTSALVSLWNQQSLGSMKANVSMSLQSSAFLLHHGEIIQKFTSDTAMVTTIGAEARVSFVNVPFDVCLTIQSGDVYIRKGPSAETDDNQESGEKNCMEKYYVKTKDEKKTPKKKPSKSPKKKGKRSKTKKSSRRSKGGNTLTVMLYIVVMLLGISIVVTIIVVLHLFEALSLIPVLLPPNCVST